MRALLTRALLSLLLALGAAPAASADPADEAALAKRYAPVVRLVEQAEECGYGEPYAPIDVERVLGEPTVALRGPWEAEDLIKIGPTAADLAEGLYEYHLDFPGSSLDPRCDYERWSDRLVARSKPTVYAHVATDPAFPGKLALQYWFFYAFNDFNNKHEGDWETIQLVFDADEAAGALSGQPVEAGYSQHEGAERASWDDEKLELVDRTHPVVHPAAGSHANYFERALYLGRSAGQGIGCDDTSGPTLDVRPVVRTIPSDAAVAKRNFPWIAFEGRWGERQEAFYNGPTGPNLKRQWTEPIAWAEEDWRDRSYAIPAAGLLGTTATDFFCAAVGSGSDVLRRTIDEPALTLFVVGTLLLLGVFALTRTIWRPATPLRVTRRRAWGQTLAAAARMYMLRRRLFIGIALAFLPIAAVNAALQELAFGTSGVVGIRNDAEGGGLLASFAFAIGAILTLAGLSLVQAATARALSEIDAGREIHSLRAYRLALDTFPRLLGAAALAVVIVVLLALTLALLPVAVWLTARWALIAQAVELENASVRDGLQRSSELVRGRWFRVASLVVVGAALALALGPVVGALLIVVTDAPFPLLNVVAGLVYVLAIPLVALTTTYVYFDATVRERLEPKGRFDELPSELPASG
ncbi:MAG: hypothetical protein M3292_08735 [Actinomycetota bacterium]|nr:hypothetical protein [Actinomycetota bacterium]